MTDSVRHDARKALVTPGGGTVHSTVLTSHLTAQQLPVGASAANLAGRNSRTKAQTIVHATKYRAD